MKKQVNASAHPISWTLPGRVAVLLFESKILRYTVIGSVIWCARMAL